MAVALGVMLGSCTKDTITTADGENGDTEYSESDYDRTISVTFSNSGNATVSGNGNEQTVTINGNNVTIANSGTESVRYTLLGSSSNGYFKVYSPSKQAIVLNGLSLTNPNGAAINLQGTASSPSSGGVTYLVIEGTNTIADGSTYTNTPSGEDEKGVLFAEGNIYVNGSGSLAVTAKGKSGIASDDYIYFNSGTVNITSTAASTVTNGDTLKPAGVKCNDGFVMNDGTLTITCSGTGAKGISSDGTGTFKGGTVTVTVTGSNFGSKSSAKDGPGGGHGGGEPGGGDSNSDNSVAAKGIKFDEEIVISGGSITVSCSNHEGIESKSTIDITGGHIYSYSSDDGINAASDLTISGGYICAHSTGNDAIDANGNCYIKGGVIYAIGASGAEVAIDANTEESKNLYVSGGTLIAIGGLESGSSLTQKCYQASSWSKNTWYSMTVGSTVYAFKTPSSGGTTLVVSGASQPTLRSDVSASGGTAYFGGTLLDSPTVSGGSDVSLSTYSGGNSGRGPGF